jgi:pyrroloquinoline quinone biosynthesis protein B
MGLPEPLVKAGKVRVWFTHLNHSNPVFEKDGAARRAIEAQGVRVLEEGEEVGL